MDPHEIPEEAADREMAKCLNTPKMSEVFQKATQGCVNRFSEIADEGRYVAFIDGVGDGRPGQQDADDGDKSDQTDAQLLHATSMGMIVPDAE
jgi:hypothetical protein